jgi:hypothetical protein
LSRQDAEQVRTDAERKRMKNSLENRYEELKNLNHEGAKGAKVKSSQLSATKRSLAKNTVILVC